jgi:hypothetical protein
MKGSSLGSRPGSLIDPEQDAIRFDYEMTMETIRMLADIRFRLLALVPFVSGATIAFLSVDPGKAPPHVILAGSVAGFLITVGVLIYNQRNTQYIHVTRERGRKLEELLNLAVKGHFLAPEHRYRLFNRLPLGADVGLTIIYSTVLAAWLFLITHSALDLIVRGPVVWITVPIAIVALVGFGFGIVHLDNESKKLAGLVVRDATKAKHDALETITERRGSAEVGGRAISDPLPG